MMGVVTFTIDDVCRAATFAMRRHAVAESEGRRAKLNRQERRCVLDDHFVGLMGEWAVCRELGVEFAPTINTYKGAPDACGFEVRTRRAPYATLVLHDNDSPDYPYALVMQSTLFQYLVCGWIPYAEAWEICEMITADPDRPQMRTVPSHKLRPLTKATV